MQPFGFAQPPPPRWRGGGFGLSFLENSSVLDTPPPGGRGWGRGLREDKSFNFNHLFQIGNRSIGSYEICFRTPLRLKSWAENEALLLHSTPLDFMSAQQ